jgi:hypothetical protein
MSLVRACSLPAPARCGQTLADDAQWVMLRWVMLLWVVLYWVMLRWVMCYESAANGSIPCRSASLPNLDCPHHMLTRTTRRRRKPLQVSEAGGPGLQRTDAQHITCKHQNASRPSMMRSGSIPKWCANVAPPRRKLCPEYSDGSTPISYRHLGSVSTNKACVKGVCQGDRTTPVRWYGECRVGSTRTWA